MSNGDPVSWLLIEPGWTVADAAGEEVGRVDEVAGDSNADIFDGLAIALSMTGKARYVPAEQIKEIVEGRVTLALDRAAVEALPAYQASEEIQISGEKASLVGRLESRLVRPSRNERIPLLRRILLWFGLAGRR
jgi:hypothetical protein